jgi:hypothetical protein
MSTEFSFGLERALVVFSDAISEVVRVTVPSRTGSSVHEIISPPSFPATGSWVFIAVNQDWDRFYLL